MVTQYVMLIILYVGYATCQQIFIFVETSPSPNRYYGNINNRRPNTLKVQQNLDVNDGIFFEGPSPNYQVSDRPRPLVIRPEQSSQPPPQTVRPLPPRPQLPPAQSTQSFGVPPNNPVRPMFSSSQAPANSASLNRPPPSTQAFGVPPSTPPRPTISPTRVPANSASLNRPTNIQTSTTPAISHGIYNLGQQILFRAMENRGRQNIKSEVISPLSIAGVGYLLYLGSAGQTATELATFLGLNRGTNQKDIHEQFGQLLDEIVNDRETRNENKEYPEFTENRIHEISVANALFINRNFALRQQYENVAHNTYKSEVRQMDFAGQGRESKRYIDNWVSNKTRGKIPTILAAPPTGNTQMIVVSALYFKALWWEELGVSRVAELPFYPNGERYPAVTVNTILFTSEFLPHYESAEMNCRIIGLKYQKQLSTMYIIQPLESNRESLRNFQSQLTAEKLDFLISRMTATFVSVLSVPKFHLQNEVDLKSIMQQMGVRSLFGSANLSPITPSRDERLNQSPANINDLEFLDTVRKSSQYGSGVSISQIHHKVDLVVNEKGTEGGAATAAYADKIFAGVIKINTPFLFVVRQDNTRLPLFYGAVFEPEQD